MPEDFVGPRRTASRVAREDPSNSRESRVFVGSPDFRVFIWGVEISSDVFSITTTQTLDENVGTATVNIVNDNAKWVLPTALGQLPFGVIPDELSDRPTSDRHNTFGALNPDTTSRVPGTYVTPMEFAKKKQLNFQRFLSTQGELVRSLVSRFQNSAHFPFLPGGSLIQAGDRIRIFLKSPWGGVNVTEEIPIVGDGGVVEDFVQRESVKEWYFGFTGFVAAVTEDFDASSNKSMLRLYCEDIRRLLRYMRVTTNPNIFQLNSVTEEDLRTGQTLGDLVLESGAVDAVTKLTNIAPDLVLFNANAAPQAGQLLVDRKSESSRDGFMEYMLMGFDREARRGDQVVVKLPADGVLGFKLGGKKIVNLPTDNTFENKLSETLDQIYPELSDSDVKRYGEDWSLGSDPDVLLEKGVEANRLWVILPDEAHFPDKRFPFDWAARIDFFSEWRSRLDLLNDQVKSLDCVWYATPKGDFVLEFPDYDAVPQRHKEPWDSILTIQNEFKGFSMTEDDRAIKTLTVMNASPIDQFDVGQGLPFLAFAKVVNPELVARYGLREQRSSRPYNYKEEHIAPSLKGLAMMIQEQANADAFRLEGLECLPNFRAAVARPYFFKYRNLIGFAEMVQHQIVWGQMAQTVYGLKYLRHFDINTGDWKKISGNYGWHWQRKEISVGADRVASGSTPQTSRRSFDDTDPSARVLTEGLGFVSVENLSAEEQQRLDEIVSSFSSQSLPTEERQRLIAEYNDIVSQASSRRR